MQQSRKSRFISEESNGLKSHSNIDGEEYVKNDIPSPNACNWKTERLRDLSSELSNTLSDNKT